MMNQIIFDNTKIAAYFLWEYSQSQNAMALWYCAEDIAQYLESSNFEKTSDIYDILKKEKNDYDYISFIRQIAFRIYIYTNDEDRFKNWIVAERLLYNQEWCHAVMNVVYEYRNNINDPEAASGIRLDKVRNYYINL